MPKARWPSRLPALALFGLCLAGAPLLNARTAQSVAPAASLASSAVPSTDATNLLNTYCVTCHNGRLKTAGLEIDSLQASSIADHAPQWEKIVTKLRTREMPPPGRPRPDPATYSRAVVSLEHALDAAAAASPHPGRVPVHRMNRNEYTNAIRDLLGLEIDARALLSSDEADQEGFDNVASVLSISPALLEELPVCGAIAQPACRRRSLAQSGDRHIQDLQGARAGRTSWRRPAVRFAGRGLDSLQLSSRR